MAIDAMNKDFKISIFCLVYNHEAYLKDCIEGFLMQRCNFNFEIVVGEDCSSDRSREILLDYHKKFPGKFKLLLHDQNVGAIQNQNLTLNACDGKYIALCEGDDYWTDPYKLQKQVDFLEANPDFVLCFHPVKILEPDGSIVEDYITKVPKNYETVETMAEKGNYIHTPSVVFRNVIKTLPDEMSQSPVGDYFLYMLLGEYGKYGIIHESMSVYRNGIGNFSVLHQLIKQVRWNTTLFLISRCLKDEVIIDIIQEKYVTSSQSLETGINNLLKKKPMVIRSMINRLKSKLLNV